MSKFYGTEFEIWAGFGPVGSTEKTIWAEYEHFLRAGFSCFRGQNKYCSVRTKKLHNISIIKKKKKKFLAQNRL